MPNERIICPSRCAQINRVCRHQLREGPTRLRSLHPAKLPGPGDFTGLRKYLLVEATPRTPA
jgi:hypothetical protein